MGTPTATSSGAPASAPPAGTTSATCLPPAHLNGVTGPPSGVSAAENSPVGKIKHIVIIIQENRTFDNIFHGFSEPSGVVADYATYGCNKAGTQIALTSVPFENLFGPNNGHADFYADYDNGKMDGTYDNNASDSGASGANNGLSYLPQVEVQPYFDMATNGSLAERFFHGVTAPTYPSHMEFVTASTTYDGSPAHRVIDNPNGQAAGCQDTVTTDTVNVLDTDNPNAPPIFPCYTGVQTITDLLDSAGLTWKYYANSNDTASFDGGFEGYDLDPLYSYAQVYNNANFSANNPIPSEQVLTDAATDLASVSWVTPDGLVNTDHPGSSSIEGPEWVASVVNAIGASTSYSSTAIFVTWDDWGGMYDHVPPPQKYAPYGLSFRIPLICISPYARAGTLVDTQLEPGSLVRFIEETFGLPSLGHEDATANSVDDMFDFTQSPKLFTPIAGLKHSRSYFLHEKRATGPIDSDALGPYGTRAFAPDLR